MNNDDIPLSYDNGHCSGHFIQGSYDHPITQRMSYNGYDFHATTDVSPNGDVGYSGFN